MIELINCERKQRFYWSGFYIEPLITHNVADLGGGYSIQVCMYSFYIGVTELTVAGHNEIDISSRSTVVVFGPAFLLTARLVQYNFQHLKVWVEHELWVWDWEQPIQVNLNDQFSQKKKISVFNSFQFAYALTVTLV